jgi:glycosyltransferase involved in cell wall biosynthesis
VSHHVDVSIITPTFRRERQVVHAIESALGQGELAVEVIVLDDSPEGSARDAVESLGSARVRYFKRTTPSNGRPALVRNEGAKLACGQFLHFLDDDDVLEPGALGALSRALLARPATGMAFGAVVPFGDNEAILRKQQAYFRTATRIARSLQGRLHLTAHLLFNATVLVNSACMTRREVFVSSGGYDAHVPVCEDVELWMRIVRATGFVYVDRPVVRYRTGASSLMHDLKENDEKLRIAYARAHRKYREEHGASEFFALKAVARTLLRWPDA